MLVEQIDASSAQDLVWENEDLAKRLGSQVESTVWRFSFFSKGFKRQRSLKSIESKQFLGYAIVKRDAAGDVISTRVYESVLRGSRMEHNYVHGGRDWRCRIQGETFSINGYLYAQQNGLTNVCAHVALRTVAATYHSAGDMSYREINDLLGIDHEEIRADDGLNVDQMVQVLESAGARCIRADYTQRREGDFAPPYQRFVYGAIESGFPAIVIFETAGDSMHAVPVFGHTMNRDTWVPSAELGYFQVGQSTKYIPSESWLSSFVIHDDNLGSNFCLPRHYLRASRSDGVAGNAPREGEWVAHVLATLPKDVGMSPLRAEVIGLDFLFAMLQQLPQDGNRWGDRLRETVTAGHAVFRTVLVTASEYGEHIAKLRDWHGARVSSWITDAMNGVMKGQRFWMVEMSVPELFSANLRKVGEVLLWPNKVPTTNRDFSTFVLARLPGYAAVYNSGGPDKPKFTFFPAGAAGHVSLFGCE